VYRAFAAAELSSALLTKAKDAMNEMSERSLQRRLAELDLSYQGVVDTFRRTEAEWLLLAGRCGMAEIALALGFADQTAFSRALRRWTRMAPRRWLAQHAR
jgi:AraC-like DNA-binding protein